MKIYIILEDSIERIVRGVTLSQGLASKICDIFGHYGVFFEEYETMENEKLIKLLEAYE